MAKTMTPIQNEHVHIGIDPGKSGAACSLVFRDNYISMFDFMAWPKEDNIRESVLFLEKQKQYFKDINITIEKVHGMPRDGSTQAFNFGKNVGTWLGIIETIGFPYSEASPQTWMKALGIITKKVRGDSEGNKKTVIKNTKEMNCKKAYTLSRQYCKDEVVLDSIQEFFKGSRGGINSGYVDAFLIALYNYTSGV